MRRLYERGERNETDSRFELIERLVTDIKRKRSLLDAEPWHQILKGDVEIIISKFDKATQCLNPTHETLMKWKVKPSVTLPALECSGAG